MVTLRPAAVADLVQINEIYNHYVRHSNYTYQSDPISENEREVWFNSHGPWHPVIVTESGGDVLGWAALNPFRPQQGFEKTVEVSIFVRRDWRGNGIGSVLMQELVRFSKEAGHHSMLAAIDSAQEACLALHAKFGFKECGRMKEVAQKQNRWLDMIWMQKILEA